MGLFRKKSSHPPVVSLRPALPKTLSLPDLHDSPSGELSLPSRWIHSSTYKEKQSSSSSPPLQAWNGGGHQRTPSSSKMSFQTFRTGFHRPFRGGAAGGGGMATPTTGTAATSPTASSFQGTRSFSGLGSMRGHRKRQVSRTSRREKKVHRREHRETELTVVCASSLVLAASFFPFVQQPTTFNLGVVGGASTGKSCEQLLSFFRSVGRVWIS